MSTYSRYELCVSRRVLEEGLGAPVTALSSPTGFFNPRMCALAREVGYQSLCFGHIGLVPDQGDPFALKRVAVKYTTAHAEFAALLRFDLHTLGRLRRRQWVRHLARHTFGPKAYLQVRRFLTTLGAHA